jgi:hypothetical protein
MRGAGHSGYVFEKLEFLKAATRQGVNLTYLSAVFREQPILRKTVGGTRSRFCLGLLRGLGRRRLLDDLYDDPVLNRLRHRRVLETNLERDLVADLHSAGDRVEKDRQPTVVELSVQPETGVDRRVHDQSAFVGKNDNRAYSRC